MQKPCECSNHRHRPPLHRAGLHGNDHWCKGRHKNRKPIWTVMGFLDRLAIRTDGDGGHANARTYHYIGAKIRVLSACHSHAETGDHQRQRQEYGIDQAEHRLRSKQPLRPPQVSCCIGIGARDLLLAKPVFWSKPIARADQTWIIRFQTKR